MNSYALLFGVGWETREDSAVRRVDRLDEQGAAGQPRTGCVLGEKDPEVLVGARVRGFRNVHKLERNRREKIWFLFFINVSLRDKI